MLKYTKVVLTGISGIAAGIYIDRNIIPTISDTKSDTRSSVIERLSEFSLQVCHFN